MPDRQISVARAFSSYAGDGSGEQRYFTAGNAHEIEDFVSADEFQYRQDAGYITVVEPTELLDPVFQVPEELPFVNETVGESTTRKSPRRGRKARSTSEE